MAGALGETLYIVAHITALCRVLSAIPEAVVASFAYT